MPGRWKEKGALVVTGGTDETSSASEGENSLESGHKGPQWLAAGRGPTDAGNPPGLLKSPWVKVETG